MSTEKKKEQQLLEDVTAQPAVQSSYSTAGLNSRKEVENALHGRKNRILFSMVYTAKIDFYQGNENLQLEMKYYR